MKNYLNAILLFIGLSASAQTSSKAVSTAEIMPQFQGGTAAITKYIATNKAVPPTLVLESKKVEPVVAFVVDANGQVKDATIVKSSGYKDLDNEALRLVTKMPQWTPGMNQNKKVDVQMTLPVSFKDLNAAK